MMSVDNAAPQSAETGNEGNKRTLCPLHGCRRTYTDVSALEAHIKDHELPAQSLPGKVLLCSTVGCSSSFPNMRKLMEHMRHHHKPNIYFLCESCRTKLRSYRGLLTHLHTCSKVPRGKTKSTEATPAPPASTTAMDIDQNPPQLESESTTQEVAPQNPNPDTSFPAAILQRDSAAPSLPGPSSLTNLETSPSQIAPQQLVEASLQPQLRSEASDVSLNLSGPMAAPDPPEAHSQQQTQSKSPGSAPHSPPGSSAVWKKSQGMACSRRILWEHTKGRYTCVQCGHSVTNRKEMTQHINTHHSSNKPAEDTGSSATNT